MNKLELNEIKMLNQSPCVNNVGFYFKVLYNYYALLQKGSQWINKLALLCQAIAPSTEDLMEMESASFMETMDKHWTETPKVLTSESDTEAMRIVFSHSAEVYVVIMKYLIGKRSKLPVRDSRNIYYCKGNVSHGCMGRFIPEAMECPKCLGFTSRLSTVNDMMNVWNAHVPEEFHFSYVKKVRTLLPAPLVVDGIVVDVEEEFVNEKPHDTVDHSLGFHEIAPPKPRITKQTRTRSLPKVMAPSQTERLMDILVNMNPVVPPQHAFFDYIGTHQRVYNSYILPLIERGIAIVSEIVNGEQCYFAGEYRIVADYHQKCGPTCYFVAERETTNMVMFSSVDEVVAFYFPPPPPPAEIVEEFVEEVPEPAPVKVIPLQQHVPAPEYDSSHAQQIQTIIPPPTLEEIWDSNRQFNRMPLQDEDEVFGYGLNDLPEPFSFLAY